LFYNHHNREGDVTIISFAIGTNQGNPWGGALLALAHFRAFRFTISHFPSCLFPSIVHDIHIINPPSIVSFAYEHFQTKLHAIGFPIQLQKCVAWSPSRLPPDFNALS